MFIRVKKIGPYEYLYLVENARERGRYVQRVIKALGRRDAVEESDLLDGLIASAARHSRRSIVLSSFYRGELSELRRVTIGPDLVFGRLWQETGCRDVLRSLLADRHFGFDVERAIYLTVLHRPMVSGSDRHAHNWHQRQRIPGAEALTLEQAYKAMGTRWCWASCWMAGIGRSPRSFGPATPPTSPRCCPSLPQFVGGGAGLSCGQDAAGDTADLPPHRCSHPRPRLLHVPRFGLAQGTDGPAHCTPHHPAGMTAYCR